MWAEINDVVSTLEMGVVGLVLAAETVIVDNPVGSILTARKLVGHFERRKPNTSFEELLSDHQSIYDKVRINPLKMNHEMLKAKYSPVATSS